MRPGGRLPIRPPGPPSLGFGVAGGGRGLARGAAGASMSSGGGGGARGGSEVSEDGCRELGRPCPAGQPAAFTYDHESEPWGCKVCRPHGWLSAYRFNEIEWWYKRENEKNYCCRAQYYLAAHPDNPDRYSRWIWGRCTSSCFPPEWGGEPEEDDDNGNGDDGDKCGPDATLALAYTVQHIYNAYVAASHLQRLRLCVQFQIPLVIDAIDIYGIHGGAENSPNCPRGADCQNTLQVDGQCHNSWVINYIAMGIGYRLCAWYVDAVYFPYYFPNFVYPYCIARHWDHAQCICALSWFWAGVIGWPAASTPGDCKPECGGCEETIANSGFHVNWDGMAIYDDGSVSWTGVF